MATTEDLSVKDPALAAAVFGVRHGFSKAKALRIAAPAYLRARRARRQGS